MSRCHEEGPFCPVELTVLGYRPNLGANAFLAASYGLCIIGIITVGVMKKTWSFSACLAVGAILELAGYIGRILMHPNVWHDAGFKLQITGLILAPTLICAAIYLTLKHLALALSPSLSRIRPRLYPLIFVPADISCLVLQAIGGSVAATSEDIKVLNHANRLIIAGIALQVAVLLIFGVVGAEYLLRVKREVARSGLEVAPAWGDKKMQTFIRVISAAYVCIAIRCIYRIAEMAGGWRNHIMQDEISFMILDGALVLIAVALLTIFPPGLYFPSMTTMHATQNNGIAGIEENKNAIRLGSRDVTDSN